MAGLQQFSEHVDCRFIDGGHCLPVAPHDVSNALQRALTVIAVPLLAVKIWYRQIVEHVIAIFPMNCRYGVAATPRARRRLWEHQEVYFGSRVADHTIIMLLGLTFCIINPIIVPFCLLYFVIVNITERYQFIYVFKQAYESGGKLWSSAFVQVSALWQQKPAVDG